MSYTLKVDNYGIITCTPSGSDFHFRAFCSRANYEALSDDTHVQISVQVITDDGLPGRKIGWYNLDTFECIDLSSQGSNGDISKSCSVHPDTCDEDQSVWAIEFENKDWVLNTFEKDSSSLNEHLFISGYEEHREAILEMCRAQACKQTALRIFDDVDSTQLMPVKHR